MRSKLANPRATTRSRTVVTLIAAMLAAMSLAVGAVPAFGADPQNGFKTHQPSMIASRGRRADRHDDQADHHRR